MELSTEPLYTKSQIWLLLNKRVLGYLYVILVSLSKKAAAEAADVFWNLLRHIKLQLARQVNGRICL